MERLLDRENGLWSNYGLRSLSAKDPYFMKGDAYWTGLIWLNINYFAASTFHKYSNNPEDYPMPPSLRNRIQDAYQELRNNLISLVVSEFMETGFIWEVYDGTTGTGHDNHPFTGWSALIVNIMAELF
jgi:mannosyl-oligosaccharide glucosidase